MKQVANVIIEVEKEDRRYQFIMPVGAPFGEAYDAAFQALSAISEMAKNAVEQAKRAESESAQPANS